MRRRYVGAAAVALSACTLLTDLDGLTGGAPGPVADAGGPDAPDAALDAAASDGGTEASVDGGCKGTKGPTPVRVGTYCIDATEVKGSDYQEFLAATAGDAGGQPPECAWNTSYAPSVSASGDRPVFGADWCDARAYCAWAGKRLCGKIGGGPVPAQVVDNAFSDEWYRACTAAGTRAFPYGNTRSANACNGADRDGGGGPVAVASLPTCEGGYPGLFDMTGNLWEWEDSCADDGGAATGCVLRGSSFAATNGTGCDTTAVVRRDRGGENDITIRCCSD